MDIDRLRNDGFFLDRSSDGDFVLDRLRDDDFALARSCSGDFFLDRSCGGDFVLDRLRGGDFVLDRSRDDDFDLDRLCGGDFVLDRLRCGDSAFAGWDLGWLEDDGLGSRDLFVEDEPKILFNILPKTDGSSDGGARSTEADRCLLGLEAAFLLLLGVSL